eukprot:1724236-Amphidinium_carterae.1
MSLSVFRVIYLHRVSLRPHHHPNAAKRRFKSKSITTTYDKGVGGSVADAHVARQGWSITVEGGKGSVVVRRTLIEPFLLEIIYAQRVEKDGHPSAFLAKSRPDLQWNALYSLVLGTSHFVQQLQGA